MGAMVAGPGMEPPDHRDTAADAPWSQGQCLSCLRRGAPQAVGDSLLVTPGHGAEFSRACEGHPEVRDWQQPTLLGCQPCVGWAMLARGPLPVLTGVVAVMVVAACVTGRAGAAKRLRAARLTVGPGAPMSGAPPVAHLSSGVGAMDADAVSALDPHGSRMRRLMAGDPRASAGTVRGVSRLGVVGEACPSDAGLSRRWPPASRRGVAPLGRSVCTDAWGWMERGWRAALQAP